MQPDLEARIFEHLERVKAARKTFDSPPDWRVTPGNGQSTTLSLRAALRLNGQLGGGASVQLTTPQESWERDVYGHILVVRPEMRLHLRLEPVEWLPRRQHRNPKDAPPDLRFLSIRDRYHSLEDNRPLGLAVFNQTQNGIARPLPRAISSFQDYLELAAEIWNFPDLKDIPPPPWSRSLV